MSSQNSKTNFIWSNKNIYVTEGNSLIIDIFQNNINLLGENSFGYIYLCVNIFNLNENNKLEYSERNNMSELRFNNKLIEFNNDGYKNLYDFTMFCKYIINTCENNQIDNDYKILLLKKYENLKR